jgi:hypothetical protein
LLVEIHVPDHAASLHPTGRGNKVRTAQMRYTSRIRCPKTFTTFVRPLAVTRCWSGP